MIQVTFIKNDDEDRAVKEVLTKKVLLTLIPMNTSTKNTMSACTDGENLMAAMQQISD
jgi:hypothetical protein